MYVLYPTVDNVIDSFSSKQVKFGFCRRKKASEIN